MLVKNSQDEVQMNGGLSLIESWPSIPNNPKIFHTFLNIYEIIEVDGLHEES